MEAFDALLRDALLVTALLVLPVLITATAVGATVAVLQAATQVQEQTLTLLPKIVSVGAMIAFFGAFAMSLLARLFNDALAALPALTGGS